MMTKQPTKPPKETKEQEEARRSQTSPPTPPRKFAEQMVPAQSVSVTVEEVALKIFSRIYMDTAGRTSKHLANRAFEAAEDFMEVARSRKTQKV